MTIDSIIICIWLNGIYRVQIVNVDKFGIRGEVIDIIREHAENRLDYPIELKIYEIYDWGNNELTTINPLLQDIDIITVVDLLLI